MQLVFATKNVPKLVHLRFGVTHEIVLVLRIIRKNNYDNFCSIPTNNLLQNAQFRQITWSDAGFVSASFYFSFQW